MSTKEREKVRDSNRDRKGSHTMNEPLELKPCPFCGGEAVEKWLSGPGWIVRCVQCGARIVGHDDEQKAAAAWNRRTSLQDNKVLTVEELRGMGGEPVWIETMQEWRIVCVDRENGFVRLYTVFNTISAEHVLDNDGHIYRRAPEKE